MMCKMLVHLDRDRHGGGVAICVANYCPFSLFLQVPIVLINFLAISVKSPYGQFVAAVLSRPPSPISFFYNLVLEVMYVTVCSIVRYFNVDVSLPNYLCSCLCNATCQYSVSIIPTCHTHM